MTKRRITDKQFLTEKIIDLTDTGNNNSMRVVRDTRSRLDAMSDHLGAFDDSPLEVIPEDRGYIESKLQRQMPEDPEGNYEDQGAAIIESTTFFPACPLTITFT
jgi:hypothetical protein